MEGDYDLSLPIPAPGMMLIARTPMRAWADDYFYGTTGEIVNEGTIGVVIQSWKVGNQVRLRMLVMNTILVLSTAHRDLSRNWMRTG